MTKAKDFPYQIQYKDNTYRMVDWTKAEFKQVGEDIKAGFNVTILDDGIFRLDDIRTIVAIPEPPEPETDEKKLEAENQMSEWGFVDEQTAEWLKAQGIDLSKGVS